MKLFREDSHCLPKKLGSLKYDSMTPVSKVQ